MSSIKELFSKLASLIRSFASDIEHVSMDREAKLPTEEIRKIISDISTRAAVDEKESAENKEIIALLEQLLVDKKIFSIINIESKEWLSLLDAIEKRISINSELFDKEAQYDIDKIKELAAQMRGAIREGRDSVGEK